MSIDEEEFNTILKVAEEENLPNVELLEKWFQLDQNSVPPKFIYVVSQKINCFVKKTIEILNELNVRTRWLFKIL